MTYLCRILNHETGETKRFHSVKAAESYARTRCDKVGGFWIIEYADEGRNGLEIATVCKDGLGRVWTDVTMAKNPPL